MQNALKSSEWRRIWPCKTLKIQTEKRGPNNLDFLQIGFAQKLGPPLFKS